ncbi:MAG: prepilin-type N-terminal cleavage/methylation domain-containing protein [Polyangiaceae bacterium]
MTDSSNTLEAQHLIVRRMIARRPEARTGVTLIEILVVITILTGLTAVLAVNVFDNLKAKLGQAELEIGKIAGQAQLWVEEPTNNGCPTVSQLIADKSLPSQQNTADHAQGTPYVIMSTG